MTRHKINPGQLDILKILYKFRFGTRELLAANLGKQNNNAMYSKLTILEQRGMIAKRYESSYNFAGRAAEYYLLPSGLRELKNLVELDGLDESAIKASYKDRTASDQFIRHSLWVFAIANRLCTFYEGLQYFTKRELTVYDYFPKPLSDGFISYKAKGPVRRYFVELYAADVPAFTIDRRLQQLTAYYEEDDWSATETPFPPILCICESGSLEKRIRRQIGRALNRADADISFYTTTLHAMLSITPGEDSIWTSIDDPDELLSLAVLE